MSDALRYKPTGEIVAQVLQAAVADLRLHQQFHRSLHIVELKDSSATIALGSSLGFGREVLEIAGRAYIHPAIVRATLASPYTLPPQSLQILKCLRMAIQSRPAAGNG